MEKRNAFTLLEILMASTIFAIALMITMSTISWASAYNNRLTEMRKVSLTGRKIMEMISDDVRKANGSVTVSGLGDVFTTGELAILCNEGTTDRFGELQHTYNLESYRLCAFKVSNLPSNAQMSSMYPIHNTTESSKYSNVLMIINENDNKVIFYRGLEDENNESEHFGDIIRYELPYATTIDLSEEDINTSIKHEQIINENGVDTFVYFGGFTPKYDDQNRKSQPFVKMDIQSKTENYDILTAQYKSKIDLTTTVETRSYR